VSCHHIICAMKTLYMIRHAKSSWADPAANDFDRVLNDRGKRDAPKMGKRLKEKEIYPDIMLSSPAKRALSTAKRMAEALKFRKEKIKTDSNLYHADDDTILDVIRGINDKHDVAMIFGHNPGLTDFVNAIAEVEVNIDNVPTCGVVAFTLDVESWKNVGFKCGRLLFFDYPKASQYD
jgi:phosphohistidine phosphatase